MIEKINPTLDVLREKLCEYISKGDAEGAASLYTEDACFMPHQSPIRQGHAEIIEAYFSDFEKGFTGIKLSPHEVLDMKDYVAERGDAINTIKVGKDKHVEIVMKYVVLWKNTPEGYKLFWDIFNPNNP